MSTELGFSEPADWYKEDQDAIDATRELFRLIEQLIVRGHHVDCLQKPNENLPMQLETEQIWYLTTILSDRSRQSGIQRYGVFLAGSSGPN